MNVSSCLGDTQFTLLSEQVSFERGQADCASRNATVARISNSSEFFVVKSLLARVTEVDEAWIGLLDVLQEGGNSTERFTFVDGSEEGRSFFAEAGKFPWGSNQPNDFPSPQHCVVYVTYYP